MSETNRRDFIRTTAATAALVAGAPLERAIGAQMAAPAADSFAVEIAHHALNAARSAGASYADVRIGRYRRQRIETRERQVSAVADDESYGLGMRTLVNGCWGFAATNLMTRESAQKTARDAVALSRAARSVQRHTVELAPAAAGHGHLDDAREAGPDRSPARREDRDAAEGQRSGARE